MPALNRKKVFWGLIAFFSTGAIVVSFNACSKTRLNSGISLFDQSSSDSSNSEASSSLDAFSLIQAENANEKSGGITDPAQTGMQGVVGGLNNGNYLKYSQVNFGSGALSATVNLGVADSFGGKTIEFRLDSPTGPLVGSLITQSTGGWQTIRAQSLSLDSLSGVRDLFLVMKGDAVANIDSFVFSKTASSTPSNPAPAPVASNPPGALTNADEVVDTMQKPHEAIVIDPRYDWQQRPMIIQYAPTGKAIPSWFPHSKPEYMYSILTWYQAFEAQGNAATNTRVQVKNLRVYYLTQSSPRKWVQIDISRAPYSDTWKYPFSHAYNGGFRNESSGGVSVKPKYPEFPHGYGNGKGINPHDIRAIFVALETRLTLDNPNGPDDRAKAKYVINAGADYWPGNGQGGDWSYAPGIGQGRMIVPTNNWRTATMIIPNKDFGTTYEELRANPPPLAVPF